MAYATDACRGGQWWLGSDQMNRGERPQDLEDEFVARGLRFGIAVLHITRVRKAFYAMAMRTVMLG